MWSTCGLLLKGPQVPRVLEILAINVYCSTIHNSSVIQPTQVSNKRGCIKKRCIYVRSKKLPCEGDLLHLTYPSYNLCETAKLLVCNSPKIGWDNRINFLNCCFLLTTLHLNYCVLFCIFTNLLNS